jgi:formylglycine-generating enzyme required for sulfatase activity
MILPLGILTSVGCGGGNSKPPLPPPATPAPPSVQEAPPAAPEIVPSEGGDAPKNSDAPRTGPLARTGNAPTGDTEPPGQEGTFALLADPNDGGSHWALDFPDAENNVDRFAVTPVPHKVDSSRFVIEPGGEGGAVPSGDENELPLPESTGNGESAGRTRLPKGFSPVPGTAISNEGLPYLIRCHADGALMGLVSEGVFVQGKDGFDENAAPEHAVLLDSFYIDLREVTFDKYEKYRALVRDAKRRIVEPARIPRDRLEPVTGITWSEARAYAAWSGRELPSEAQWEKAARGTEGFNSPWGNDAPLWHLPRTIDQLDRVGSYKGDVSPFGICDMAGNAREWCQDAYQEKYYRQLAAESGSTVHNPPGPRGVAAGGLRVVKGGDPQWRVWKRTGVNVAERPIDIGFRCVLRLEGDSESKR